MDASARTSVPAVHEWHIERILEELGILADVSSGSQTCVSCGATLSLDGIGALVRGEGTRVLLSCERVACLDAASGRAVST